MIRRITPHIRGDHITAGTTTVMLMRSPPHTWGPHDVMAGASPRARITPTYVGTTMDNSKKFKLFWDHPHIRGDH